MKNPKIRIAVGSLFAAAWLSLGAGELYGYLTGSDMKLASLLIGEAAACCGIVWGGLQIYAGIRKLKGEAR